MCLKDIGHGHVEYVQVAQNTVKLRVLVNTLITAYKTAISVKAEQA
jgi:hypothetical protein